jgi:hypothetical protein
MMAGKVMPGALDQFQSYRKHPKKTSGAKAGQFMAAHRRHKCLLHPVMVYIYVENGLDAGIKIGVGP